jgi:acid phosphatase type 7
MDATGWRRVLSILVATGAVACRIDFARDEVPSTRETLRTVGRRLSKNGSERELTAIASSGAELLARLERSERMALGAGHLRFRVDRAVIVDVAAPIDSIPFWLADRGFRETDLSLVNPNARWRLYRRVFDCGSIGLGVNGLDRSPSAHYVVFIRPLDRRQTGQCLEPPAVTLDERDRDSWRVVVAAPGVSAACDVARPFATIPDELAGAILLQPSHADRHSSLLAKGRVWKTHVVSTPRADQVAISFGSDPARELVWTWRTSQEVVASAVRIVAATEQGGMIPADGSVRIVNGDSCCLEIPNVLNDPVVRRHRVVVNGLEPDRVYRYALGDGTTQGWGPWRTVKTAPARGRPVRFLYLGDAQTGLERWGRLLEGAVRRHPGIDFIVLAGDLVDRGNERTNWDHFFLRAALVFDRFPLMPCVGNHEYLDVGPRLYRAFFELPRNGPRGIDPDLVYSFEVGDACFAVLDSTLAVWDSDAAHLQAEWLDRLLSQSRARWNIAIFHHPVYPSHPWRDMPALRRHWVPVFDKHHVDLVLQGHDHAYQRTYPLRGHSRVESPDRGTIYVIAVSGDKYVEQVHREHVEIGLAEISSYQTIEIDPRTDRLSYRAWTEEGRVVDAFEIDKGGHETEPPLASIALPPVFLHRRPARSPGEGVDAPLPSRTESDLGARADRDR